MSNIKIPYAFDESHQLVKIDDADKSKKYFCPACCAPVIVRKGEIKVHHYSHKANQVCNQETATHKLAKLLLQQHITDWKEGRRSAPSIRRSCHVCRTEMIRPLPDKVERAELEVRLSDGSIVDVALIALGIPVAAIEVRVTHAVDEEKEASLPVPFIEVDGDEIIAGETPINLLVDKFKPLICSTCKARYPMYVERAKVIAHETGQPLPGSYYRYGIHTCWKCNKKMLVYAWPNSSELENNEPGGQPRPSTVKYRYSNTQGESYWANCCPYCDAIQGDFYLYSKPDGPFFSLEPKTDTAEAFNLDMIKIAWWDAYVNER